MSIKTSKIRLTITIEKNSELILEKLLPLHPRMTKSQVLETALIAYGQAVSEHYAKIIKEEKTNEKH